MNITFSSTSLPSAMLLGPVHALVRFFAPEAPATGPHPELMAGRHNLTHCSHHGARLSAAGTHRTVRILRIADEHTSPRDAGRMVIAGRFADVCAELDRLDRQN